MFQSALLDYLSSTPREKIDNATVAYLANLSPASVVTLKLQGGPMSPEEAARFETERFSREAVLVRRCDDRGKVAGLRTAGLADYRAMIEEWAAATGGSCGTRS